MRVPSGFLGAPPTPQKGQVPLASTYSIYRLLKRAQAWHVLSPDWTCFSVHRAFAPAVPAAGRLLPTAKSPPQRPSLTTTPSPLPTAGHTSFLQPQTTLSSVCLPEGRDMAWTAWSPAPSQHREPRALLALGGKGASSGALLLSGLGVSVLGRQKQQPYLEWPLGPAQLCSTTHTMNPGEARTTASVQVSPCTCQPQGCLGGLDCPVCTARDLSSTDDPSSSSLRECKNIPPSQDGQKPLPAQPHGGQTRDPEGKANQQAGQLMGQNSGDPTPRPGPERNKPTKPKTVGSGGGYSRPGSKGQTILGGHMLRPSSPC